MALFVLAIILAALWVIAGNEGTSVTMSSSAPARTAAAKSPLLVYAVNKKVSDFPANEDLSTPETAYANLSRLSASGDLGFWKRISEPSLAARMPDETGTRKLSQKVINETLNTEVLEVRIYANRHAAVLAKVPSLLKTTIDLRCFERVGGRWMNTGQDIYGNLDAARAKFTRIVAFSEAERIQK